MSVLDLLLGGGVGAILLAIVQALFARKKLAADTDKASADATSVLTAAATALVQPLEHRINQLTGEVDGLRTKVQRLTNDLDASHAREAAGVAREAAKDALIAELRAGVTTTEEET